MTQEPKTLESAILVTDARGMKSDLKINFEGYVVDNIYLEEFAGKGSAILSKRKF